MNSESNNRIKKIRKHRLTSKKSIDDQFAEFMAMESCGTQIPMSLNNSNNLDNGDGEKVTSARQIESNIDAWLVERGIERDEPSANKQDYFHIRRLIVSEFTTPKTQKNQSQQIPPSPEAGSLASSPLSKRRKMGLSLSDIPHLSSLRNYKNNLARPGPFAIHLDQGISAYNRRLPNSEQTVTKKSDF